MYWSVLSYVSNFLIFLVGGGAQLFKFDLQFLMSFRKQQWKYFFNIIIQIWYDQY